MREQQAKHTIDLRLSFRADDPGQATRKVRALLKWLLRAWGLRCESCEWRDGATEPRIGPSGGLPAQRPPDDPDSGRARRRGDFGA